MHGRGDMHGRGHAWQGACVLGAVRGGGVHGREHAWQGVGMACMPPQILQDALNEQALCILMECILVNSFKLNIV